MHRRVIACAYRQLSSELALRGPAASECSISAFEHSPSISSCVVSALLSGCSRRLGSSSSASLPKWQPGLKALSRVPNLAYYNDELADACARDRAMSRQQLFHRLSELLDVRAITTEMLSLHTLERLEAGEVVSLLRPCVGDPKLLSGDASLLRTRLLAVMQYTALQGAVSIDLYDRADMQLMNEHYLTAVRSGQVHLPKPLARRRIADKRSVPEAKTVRECLHTMIQSGGGPTAVEALITPEQAADILVDSRLEDIAIIDLRCFEGQRIADTLVLASGRSSQHAKAGARAVQYRLKELQRQGEHAVEATLEGSLETGWFFCTFGGVSVHCFDRDTRADANLEELWGRHNNLTWYRADERPLTLDNITAN